MRHLPHRRKGLGTSENPNDSAWDSTKRVVSFWMKGECASMNVQVSASTGAKYVQYLFGTGTNGALSGGNAKVYLGYAAPEDWVRFERNVEADFEAYAGGGATWTDTDGLYISWPKSLLSYAFYVDDLRLSDSLTVEHNTLGPGVIGHILRHTTWDATTLAKTDRWFHYDQVGSVLNESDADGDDVTRHEQDAFGNVMQGWGSGLWDGGDEGGSWQSLFRDNSVALVPNGQRWIDKTTSVFVSASILPDYAEQPFDSRLSNPVHFVDLNGMEAKGYHPLGQWWRTHPLINKCPPREPSHNGDGSYGCEGKFCQEGKRISSEYHPGSNSCYREIVPQGSLWLGGSQCCYDSSGSLITKGPGAGTYDLVGTAVGSISWGNDDFSPWGFWVKPYSGTCNTDFDRVKLHGQLDVKPYKDGGL